MCEKLCQLSVKTILADSYECTDSYTGYDGHCYRFFTNSLSYSEAKAYCKNQGGYLASITSQGEQDYVEGNNLRIPAEQSGMDWLGFQVHFSVSGYIVSLININFWFDQSIQVNSMNSAVLTARDLFWLSRLWFSSLILSL